MENQGNVFDEDANLVKLSKEGCNESFNKLVLKYQDRIYNVIARSVKDLDLAADLTQDTFVNAYKGIRKFKECSSFFTWLFRIAINNVKNSKRKNSRIFAISKLTSKEESEHLFEPEDHNKPINIVEHAERDMIVQQMISSIEEPFRTAVILRDIENLSYEQMQEVLDCPLGTVRSRIHRGRAMIKEKLEKYL